MGFQGAFGYAVNFDMVPHICIVGFTDVRLRWNCL